MSKFLILTVIVYLLSGCGLSKAKPEAEELWLEYFETVQSGSFEAVLPLYSNEFYQTISKGEWISVLRQIQEKLGKPESYQQVNWNIKAQAHSSRSGTIITLIYDVHYSKHEARETVVVFKPASGEDAHILAHNINSKAFLSE